MLTTNPVSSYRTNTRIILTIGSLLGILILGMAIFGEQKMGIFTQILFIAIGGGFFISSVFFLIKSFCSRDENGVSAIHNRRTLPVIPSVNSPENSPLPTAPFPTSDTVLYDTD